MSNLYPISFHLSLFHTIFGGIITFFTMEVFWWAVVLNKHSRWMYSVQSQERRDCFIDGWFRIFMASVMACGMSFIAFFWEVYILFSAVMGILPHGTYAPWVIAGLQLNSVHFYAILARCACIHVDDWPPVSRAISRMLNLDDRVNKKV